MLKPQGLDRCEYIHQISVKFTKTVIALVLQNKTKQNQIQQDFTHSAGEFFYFTNLKSC